MSKSRKSASAPVIVQEDSLALSVCHSLGLLVVLIAQFHFGILEAPVKTLAWGSLGLSLLQYIMCAVSAFYGARVSSGVKRKEKNDEGSILFTAALSTVLSFALAPLICLFLIVMGAPGLTSSAETAILAVHVSLLSTQRLIHKYGLESSVWEKLMSLRIPLNGQYASSIGVWIGLWLGAIPIPLDWDRPWQQWPITLIIGAYLGAIIGDLVGSIAFLLRKQEKRLI